MTSIPAVGSVVTVVTRHRNHVVSVPGEFVDSVYTGTVVSLPQYWKDFAGNTFAVETGNDKHPVSLIHIDNVLDIKFASGQALSTSQLRDLVKLTATVAGSKGNVYTVQHAAGRWTCTCTGFEFRQQCKHIASVKGKINA